MYTRSCDLQDSSKVFRADLYYHRVCLPDYVNKYNRPANENNNKTEVKTTKTGTFNLYVQGNSGNTISPGEIRDMISGEYKINLIPRLRHF